MQRILVVDDEPRNRALVRGVLGRRYEIVEAGSAAEACAVLATETIDLVLLDVMMPGESGIAALPRIKAFAGDHLLPVILLTALSDQADRNAGLLAGADDFLTKPFDHRELSLRVDSFVRLRAQDQLIRGQHSELHKLQLLKDDLFGLLVHDLRNPLSSVISMLQVLEEDAASPQALEDAPAGLVAARRVGAVVEDILELVALEAGQIQLLWAECSLSNLADDAVSTVRGAARDRNVDVQVHGEIVVPGDHQLLRRALENLLANAVRYAPSRSCIDVDIRSDASNAIICVNDRGPGVPADQKLHLFEKGGGIPLKVHGAGRRSYGFGLYLVDLVARAHHGTTRVLDRVGGGASFELTLPRLAV